MSPRPGPVTTHTREAVHFVGIVLPLKARPQRPQQDRCATAAGLVVAAAGFK
jgi:hypothetical protein